MAKQVLAINFRNLPFDNPHVKEYFASVIQQYSIVEYYLLEGAFRFLLVDAQGKAYTLWIQSREEADAFAYELQTSERDISTDLRNAINSHKQIFCIPLKDGVMLDKSEWKNYSRDAVKIGSSVEFLAVLETRCDLDRPIASFESKRKEHIANVV